MMKKDTERFKQQFLPLHPRLYRIAYALTENSRDAEDILQEAYCKLWMRRKELLHIRNAEAFCVTMVKNLCLDFLHSARHTHEATSPDKVSLTDNRSPETETIEQDEVSLVKRLIDRLPAAQRQVLRLHSIDGCSQEEIEQLTGFGAAKIRVLLFRARKRLREQYIKSVSYERERF